ncbi:MAG: hypothetical protein EBZ48_16545, partial [Proteobacteria bacterium]|nr:hypothetical protein [Pseudomonadota bacterium]
MISRSITRLLVLAALATNAPGVLSAEEFCYLNRYILSRKIAPGAERAALQALQQFNLPLNTQESNSALLVSTAPLVSTKRKLINPASKLNLCNAARSERRTRLKDRANGKKVFIRGYDCDCDYRVTTSGMPNDPQRFDQWAITQQNNIDMNLPEAWDMCTGSSNTVVAVIDTGVDYNHPDLRDNIWRNPGEIPNNGIDDDRNGYID